jgi:hypothetical protein
MPINSKKKNPHTIFRENMQINSLPKLTPGNEKDMTRPPDNKSLEAMRNGLDNFIFDFVVHGSSQSLYR